jgi:hypothetical protein
LSYPGIWHAPLATALILTGLGFGFLLFLIGRTMPTRRAGIFIGGEVLEDRSGVKASAFYNTIKDVPILGRIYAMAEKKVFDIYEQGSRGTFFLTDILRWLHNGILPTYMVWCLIGILMLLFIFVR